MNGRYDVRPGEKVRIPAGARWVQFTGALTDKQHRAIGRWLEDHPDTDLRVYGNYGNSIVDLEFLRFYPELRGFEIDSMYRNIPDLAGLRNLPDSLQRLRLGVPSGDYGRKLLARTTSLTALTVAEHKRLPSEVSALTLVTRLFIAGPVKDLSPVSPLTGVVELGLGSVTVDGLSELAGMTNLRSLRVSLGGTRDLSALPMFSELSYLELVMIRGFSNLSMLPAVASLEHLKLEAMKNVLELPDLSGLSRLREVELHTMKGIRDLRPVAAAPALETFWLTSAMHLQPEVLKPFVGHPTLRRARVGFGSDRKNQRAKEILNLAD